MKNTQIITVASYFGTGSSAVTDYLREFSSVESTGDFEFRFAHDPDGLSELEFNLIENFNRHNSGHAIKRYKKLVDYYSSHWFAKRYERFFYGEWEKISYEYIDSLISFRYPGIWHYDLYDKGFYFDLIYRLILRVAKYLHFGGIGNLWTDVTYASALTEEEFLRITKIYTSKLINIINKKQKPYVVLDQLMPSSNIYRHSRYFDNIKIFLVDRDPRDLFISSKYIWKDNVVPKEVDLFCQWYIYNRMTQKTEMTNKNVMFIQFEDLLYSYSKTTDKIKRWIGLDEEEHIYKKKYFVPEISINNTRLWEKKYPCLNEISYIEKVLHEYLYVF